jgi:iron complex outermembrane receptor protein
MTSFRRRLLLVTTAATALLTTAAAQAQAPSAAPAASPDTAAKPVTALEEVVVVARRREENIQAVPVAVTAVSGKTIEKAGVTSVALLGQQTPALVIAPTTSRATPAFAIRGQRQQDYLPTVDQSVAVYVGDLYLSRQFGIDQALFDIASVDVLRGPQGTLFGRNSTGGAIIIRPAAPTHQFEGYAAATIGDYDRRQFEAVINIPIADDLALRLGGMTFKRDGYVTNVATGTDIDNEDYSALRGTLKFDPAGGFDSTTIANYFKSDGGGTPFVLSDVSPSNSAPVRLLGLEAPLRGLLAQQQQRGFYQTAQDIDPRTRVKTFDVQNSTAYEFDGGPTLRNIVGYRDTSFSDLNDIDGSVARILEIQNNYEGDQVSDELQLSDHTGILNWITGLYYFRETGSNDTTSYTGSPVLDNFINPRLQQFSVKNVSKSVYGQGTFDLAALKPGLTFTVGARYTWDERKADLRSLQAVGVAPGTPTLLGFPSPGERCLSSTADGFGAYPDCSIALSTSFSKLSYNISLEYKPADGVLLYLATRQGYRSGGFNARAQLAYQLTPFRPEVVRDVEAGIKADWTVAGAPVRTNLSVYYSDFKDAQRLAPNLIGGVVTTDVVNAAAAHVQGAELEFSVIPVSPLTIGGFVSYADAAYDEYVVPGPGGVGVRDLSDTARFAQTPKWTYSLNARLAVPTPSQFGDLSLSATYYHQGSVYVTDNTEPAGHLAGWGTLGLRADLERVGGKPVDLGVFVRNVTGEKYYVAGQTLNNDIGFASRIPGSPRTFGVSLRYSFGGR